MAQEIAERVRKKLERKGIQIDDKHILTLECKEPACQSPTSTVVKEKTKKKKTQSKELRLADVCANVQAARFSIVEVDPDQDPLFLHKSKKGIEPKKLDGGSSYIDDWIIEFAQLFKNHVGFDSDGYLELHDVGMKLYSEAIEDIVTCDDAQYLFDIAAVKFQEMAALALFNWGNVHMLRARKRAPLTEDASTKSVLTEVRKAYE
ncbi:putative heat shock protein 70 HSP70-interacting protein [Cinnamomum micranthum f. kanehirae]|uniref:Putative heat shock protein 70 HSP70-interacting protein n=1 Tax=Cinnamomum micranthum f. kanehirae TaxID=337451 RepID=A0A3S3R1S5_9MAGN|nr:putative heat shock protein 70 HSP70-interacting protein [Cinnamomum micranthum f. kanehirae]